MARHRRRYRSDGVHSAGPWDFIDMPNFQKPKPMAKSLGILIVMTWSPIRSEPFCSLTVHCAQCHQHKFDPITQEDYYRLHTIFSALDRTDRRYIAIQCCRKNG